MRLANGTFVMGPEADSLVPKGDHLLEKERGLCSKARHLSAKGDHLLFKESGSGIRERDRACLGTYSL